MSVQRGDFCTSGFCFLLKFLLASLKLKAAEAAETPCFVLLSVISRFQFFHLPETPKYEIFLFSVIFIFWPQKRAKTQGLNSPSCSQGCLGFFAPDLLHLCRPCFCNFRGYPVKPHFVVFSAANRPSSRFRERRRRPNSPSAAQ